MNYLDTLKAETRRLGGVAALLDGGLCVVLPLSPPADLYETVRNAVAARGYELKAYHKLSPDFRRAFFYDASGNRAQLVESFGRLWLFLERPYGSRNGLCESVLQAYRETSE